MARCHKNEGDAIMMPAIDNWNPKLFRDRIHAGRELANRLAKYTGKNSLILALPRGGVVIAYEVAKQLGIPFDVIISRKLALPYQKEFGIGAIGEKDVRILDDEIIDLIHLPPDALEAIIQEERRELARRINVYRNNKPLPDLKNKTVILVDDGLATGVTAKAAIQAIKKSKPKRIIFASPICAYDTAKELNFLVDEVICLATPLDLIAIGYWYDNFEQVTDEEVLSLLKRAEHYYRTMTQGGAAS